MEELKSVYQSYLEYKAALDAELQQTAESFVRIGYLLKVAMDTDILRESGYMNVNDFAKAEYGIDSSQVSRFININNRFSEGGYSDRLKEGYRGIGYAKLSIMLTLPDSINEEITPEYSKTEIQAIKEEYEEERKKTDMEILLEGEQPDQQTMENNLTKALYQLLHDTPALYMDLCKISQFAKEYEIGSLKAVDMQETLAPQGTAMYSVRLQGIGRLMLSIKSTEEDIMLINLRDDSKESFKWQQAVDFLNSLAAVKEDGMTGEDAWENIFKEPFPEEAPPVPEDKPEPRKKSKITKAPEKPVTKPEKPAKEQTAEKIAPVQPISQEELPYDGCQELAEYAELTEKEPAGQQAEAVIDGQKVDAEIEETRQTTECVERSEKEMVREAGSIIRNINNALHFSDYKLFKEQAQELLIVAERLYEMQDEED